MTEADPEEPPDRGRTSTLRRTRGELRRTFVITTALALLAGIVFPAIVLVAGQLVFSAQVTGSLIRDAYGQVTGSTLIYQEFVPQQAL
ncbi:MAG: potassium-transporting ATPase subunit C, partial [Candidatus Limnocylindria bacterium]